MRQQIFPVFTINIAPQCGNDCPDSEWYAHLMSSSNDKTDRLLPRGFQSPILNNDWTKTRHLDWPWSSKNNSCDTYMIFFMHTPSESNATYSNRSHLTVSKNRRYFSKHEFPVYSGSCVVWLRAGAESLMSLYVRPTGHATVRTDHVHGK